ncbi:hypothetical protein WG902_20825 [Ramlibacter sp. PS3R-8]|uniref:hypothetical protein n=1 Tax=Ramlibacter sp. PS3R-8 TaxID=3133437 RepID=UPI0030AAAB41
MKTHPGNIPERLGAVKRWVSEQGIKRSSMSDERTLYIHIGCGKTGSSALQVWLNHQADVLRRLGVDYPSFGRRKLDDYAITSGNGKKLIDAIAAGEGEAFMQELAKSPCGKIFLSSEAFQSLSDETLRDLKAQAARVGLRVAIIVYVRDVYDYVYSAYQQLIKRHLGTQTFRMYGLKRDKIQQFEVVASFARNFENLHVYHYDSERERGLEKSMLEALGVNPAKVPPMPDTKVNRSLDAEESELLRMVNQKYVQYVPGGTNSFSARISDALIYADPEHETEILLDDKVLRHLEVVFRPAIEHLNTKYLSKTPMKVFDPTGKKIVRELPPVRAIYTTVIDTVVKLMAAEGESMTPGEGAPHRPLRPGPARQGMGAGNGAAAARAANGAAAGRVANGAAAARVANGAAVARGANGPAAARAAGRAAGGGAAAAGEPLACTDPRLVNALRNEAIRIEKEDPQKALALMTAAAALRPNGAAIKKKLKEYQATIQ